MSEPSTRLIERQRLDALLETSRAGTPVAHTVRRARERARDQRRATDHQPSALRGLAMVIAATVILRALIGWLFF
jgi:hypothetical protein